MPRSNIATMRATILRSLLRCIATTPRSSLRRSFAAKGNPPPLGTFVPDEPVLSIGATGRQLQDGRTLSVGEGEVGHHFLLRTSDMSSASA